MIRSFEFKIYPNNEMISKAERWMRACAWVYNRALEHRIKAWKRRKENIGLFVQGKLLTKWRARMEWLRTVPYSFLRDALRRVDRGMNDFFRRVKAGDTPGFPRFKKASKWSSMECLVRYEYVRGRKVYVTGLGEIPARGRDIIDGVHKSVQIVKRSGEWFAKVVVDSLSVPPEVMSIENVKNPIGLDMGLIKFVSTSDGMEFKNPKFLKNGQVKIQRLNRRVRRRVKGSKKRQKAVASLSKIHRKVKDQRKCFCHSLSTFFVRKYDFIAVEDLNVESIVKSKFGKTVLDAGWIKFQRQLLYKAECAGQYCVKVDSRKTSQECPDCGAVKRKMIYDRIHECPCGCVMNRDIAAGQIILKRGLELFGVESRSGASRNLTPEEVRRPRPPVIREIRELIPNAKLSVESESGILSEPNAVEVRKTRRWWKKARTESGIIK